jgi:hypothetical protein
VCPLAFKYHRGLDRLTGIKRLRVKGFEAVRFCAIIKAAGLNLGPWPPKMVVFGFIFSTYRVFKKRAQAGVTNFGLIFPDQAPGVPGGFKLAA